MKINIASVLKNEGSSMNIHGKVDIEPFDFCGSYITFCDGAAVNGRVVNIGGCIELSCKVTGKYTTQCSRCGCSVAVDVEEDVFESTSDNFSDADEECLTLSGSILDITGSVKASIFNNIPLKFLCKEDCKGLCPRCGTNLNESKCNCEVEF